MRLVPLYDHQVYFSNDGDYSPLMREVLKNATEWVDEFEFTEEEKARNKGLGLTIILIECNFTIENLVST